MRAARPVGEPSGVRLLSDERDGVTVILDGVPQSYVRLDDPELLAFEYVQHLALVLDTLPAGPLAVTHVGGGGLTLPRYVAATRAGSPQIVLEPDAALTEVVRRELPLPRGHRIRVRPLDGASGVLGLGSASADAVVVDAYAAGRVPAELTTSAFLEDVRRVLRPGGVVLMNVADEPNRHFLARVLATMTSVGYASVLVIATSEVMRGRRFGNTVVAAAASGGLDVDAIRRAVARLPLPSSVRSGPEVRRMVAGARPLTEDDPSPSPLPPDPGAWRAI